MNGLYALRDNAAMVQADAESARFEILLERRLNTSQGWYEVRSGGDLAGAFYGRISRE